jgi:L-threonylcarbamoyladenylate synthase
VTQTARIVPADHSHPDPALVARIATLLRGGGVVAMRTDTVYGLLGSVNRPDALTRLVALKVRPVGKPFVLLAADWIAVRAVSSHLTPVARILGQHYWPGPLTLVLPAHEDLPDEVTAAGQGVAVRIPGDPLLREVLRATGAALAAPSANLPGEAPAPSAAACVELFGDGIDLAIDGGPAPLAVPSTIVDCRGPVGEVLRAGPVKPGPRELAP